MRSLVAILVAATTCASCARDTSPRIFSLARGFRPRAEVVGEWTEPYQGGARLAIEAAEGERDGVWIRAELARSDWRPSEHFEDGWQLLRPVFPEGASADGTAQRLTAGAREFTFRPFDKKSIVRGDRAPAGTFCGYLDQLYLQLEPGEEPPDGLVYSVFVSRGRNRDGAWRVRLGPYHADGIPTWSGHPERLVAELPREGALRFATIARAGSARGLTDATLRFRLEVDGEEIFAHEQEVSDRESVVRHTVDLTEFGGRAVELRFSTEGPAALAAFLTPTIGPLAIGEPGTRSWGDERPDLVLFLADTFRADAMETYGGELGVTPALDALAAESLVFRRAWSSASWTLPSQATMLSGLHPYQHGANRSLTGLAPEAVTIAEVLSDAGYRTVGITDAAFLSHRFRMDQGFEWFDERVADKRDVAAKDSMLATLDRVDEALAADDGRPLFLWVQTYRVHFPYVVSEATREQYGDRLDLSRHWKEVEQAMREMGWHPNDDLPDGLRASTGILSDLYYGGVVDFDRMFGEWVDARRAEGFFEHAAMVFTSDHGESFGDHGAMLHGTGVWESQVRIPLFLYGAGVEPGVSDLSASLVDLPRTFADLAGVPPHESWRGVSLLDLAVDRPVFTFESSIYDRAAQALIEGDRKLILPEGDEALTERRLRGAYDLGTDPAEAVNLLEADEPWIDELLQRRLDEWTRVRRPVLPESPIELSADDLNELENLGYLAGEDE